MSTIDLKDIQQKLYEKLKPSGWADRLKGFLLSDEFHTILRHLHSEATAQDKRFTPGLKHLFRAFEECPYSELKVIIINQEPYSKVGVADGIAFSCANSDKIQTSLKYMYEEIDNTVNEFHDHDKDLSKWSNQGILLLNTSLTTRVGEPMMHAQLWKPFMNYLFDMLSNYNTGLVYVFIGGQAKEWRTSVSKNNFKFFTTHPASAAFKEADRWDSGNLFNQINKILMDHYKTEIKW